MRRWNKIDCPISGEMEDPRCPMFQRELEELSSTRVIKMLRSIFEYSAQLYGWSPCCARLLAAEAAAASCDQPLLRRRRRRRFAVSYGARNHRLTRETSSPFVDLNERTTVTHGKVKQSRPEFFFLSATKPVRVVAELRACATSLTRRVFGADGTARNVSGTKSTRILHAAIRNDDRLMLERSKRRHVTLTKFQRDSLKIFVTLRMRSELAKILSFFWSDCMETIESASGCAVSGSFFKRAYILC